MSYTHCKHCYKTIHTSDIELTGTCMNTCSVCPNIKTVGNGVMEIIETDYRVNAIDRSTDLNSRHPMKFSKEEQSPLRFAIEVTETTSPSDGGALFTIDGISEEMKISWIKEGLYAAVNHYDHKVADGDHNILHDVTITISGDIAQKCFEIGFTESLKILIKADEHRILEECMTDGTSEEECLSQTDRKRSNMMNSTDEDI